MSGETGQAQIARAEKVAANRGKARSVLKKLFQPNDYSIEKAYSDSVSVAYAERDLLSRTNSLLEKLHEIEPFDLDDELKQALRKLMRRISKLLEVEE